MEPARIKLPVAATAIAVALVVGILVGTALAPSGDSDGGQAPGRKAGRLVQGSRVVDGVRVGFPRTCAGAAAAALSYGAAQSNPRITFDKRKQQALATRIGTKAYERTFHGAGGRALDALRRSNPIAVGITKGERTVFAGVPVAYRVTDCTSDSATVTSWGVGVLGNDTTAPPRASWTTSTTRLVWQNGDWKVAQTRQTDGPTPRNTHDASDPNDVISTIDGSRELNYAP